MEKNNKISFQINLHWIYLAGLFLIISQLINIIPPWFTPTDWGKVIIFRIVLSSLIFLFLFQILFKKIDIQDIKEKIKSVSLPFWLLVSLFVVYLLSTVFSLDPHFSLWGDPQRNGGFVNFSFYIALAMLIFLIFRKNDWQKIWDFSIIIGIIVAIIAILQQFGLFSSYLLSVSDRPMSTMGNPILLAIYLLLLSFLPIALGIKTKKLYKKIFYFSSTTLFVLIIVFLTETRGAFLGLFLGFIWFLFAYPNAKIKKIKIYAGLFLLLAILGTYFLKTYMDSHLYLYQRMNPIVSKTLDRTLSIFEGTNVIKSRLSTWKIAWNAFNEKPIWGWGPENFRIGFDKNYDPSLPVVGPESSGRPLTEWWDRAHNFIFDISVTTGLPSLLIYLSIFGVLFWRLQKIKSKFQEKEAVIANSIQAALIGYLTALFFGFDSVPTYLIFFLFVGYSMYLISRFSTQQKEPISPKKIDKIEIILNKLYPLRIPITLLLFIFLIFFIQTYNLKPLRLNKEMNIAEFYSENDRCQNTIAIINEISPQIKNSIIDNYLNQKSVLLIYNCFAGKQTNNEALIKKASQITKGTTVDHPAYLQNWFMTGEFINMLIEEKNKFTGNVYVPNAEMEKLKEEANYYFAKARSLSPRRQIVIK